MKYRLDQRIALFARIAPCALFLLLACASQDERPVSSQPKKELTIENGATPFIAAASQLIPSVVNISVADAPSLLPRFRLPKPFDRLFRGSAPKQLPQSETQTLGSGLITDSHGHILTNYHVVHDLDRLIVRLADNTVFHGKDVKIVGLDQPSDLAVLQIVSSEPLPAAKLGNSDSVKIGDWAIAVGNPFGLEGSVTVGVISAAGRSGFSAPQAPDYQDFIQTDAAINPGNSGGPLANIRGEVIGINTAIRSPVQGNVGVGFAIPINSARRIAERLIADGKVVRSYLGVYLQEVTPSLREALGLSADRGVLVSSVMPGSPAARAGIRADDVITEVNREPVSSLEHLRAFVSEQRPGTILRLTIMRVAGAETIAVRLQEQPAKLTAAHAPPKAKTAEWQGITLAELTTPERQVLKITGGVRVVALQTLSSAAQAGIIENDVIVSINRQSVKDLNDFLRRARPLSRSGKPITLGVKRGDTSLLITFLPD